MPFFFDPDPDLVCDDQDHEPIPEPISDELDPDRLDEPAWYRDFPGPERDIDDEEYDNPARYWHC
jgi:hypothetical protein